MKVEKNSVLDLGKSATLQLKPGDDLLIKAGNNFVHISMTKRGGVAGSYWETARTFEENHHGEFKLKRTKK